MDKAKGVLLLVYKSLPRSRCEPQTRYPLHNPPSSAPPRLGLRPHTSLLHTHSFTTITHSRKLKSEMKHLINV